MADSPKESFEGIVIGGSWGSVPPLSSILSALPSDFSIPIAVVLHRGSGSDEFKKIFGSAEFAMKVYEPNDRDAFLPGRIFLAPADYHMLIDNDKTICLSTSDKTSHARPSIDELFETAADCFGDKLIGIILSGASKDGSNGLRKIKEKGGVTIAQNPLKASAEMMIRSAMKTNKVDFVYNADQIGNFLVEMERNSAKAT
jgi:two-component system chemotaxis response regulator CheB